MLDFIHSDVCTMTKKLLSRAFHFVTFIDDHSRKVWVSLLKTRYQVLEAFKEFYVKVERETGQKIEECSN